MRAINVPLILVKYDNFDAYCQRRSCYGIFLVIPSEWQPEKEAE